MNILNLPLVRESDLEYEMHQICKPDSNKLLQSYEPADQCDENRRSEMDIGNVQVGDSSLGGHHISR